MMLLVFLLLEDLKCMRINDELKLKIGVLINVKIKAEKEYQSEPWQ